MIRKINVMHLVVCFHDKLTLESKTFVQNTAWKDLWVKGRAMRLVMGLMSLAIIGIFSILSSFFCFLGLSAFLPSSPLFRVEVCVELHGPSRKSPCSLYSPLPVSQPSFCLDWRDFVFVGIPLTQSHSYSDQCQSSCHRHTPLTSFLFVCLARYLSHISTECLGEYHLYASLFSFSVLFK